VVVRGEDKTIEAIKERKQGEEMKDIAQEMRYMQEMMEKLLSKGASGISKKQISAVIADIS